MVAAPTAKIISQVSCFSSPFSRNRRRSILFQQPLSYPEPKFSVVMSLGNDFSGSEIKTSLSAAADQCPFLNPSAAEEFVTKENVRKEDDDPVKNAYGSAKLHDFCLGIPYGGFIISGGLLGFIFSRHIAPLSTMLYGGALLFLSTLSLKNWRQGKSSLPFVLGQAVLSAALLWKNVRLYTLTKKLIPMAFYAVISAAMLCFYAHVMISGGNPRPKKLHSSANI